MIILRALAHGVAAHAGVRFTEWLGAVPLLGIGAVLCADPGIFSTTPSFAALNDLFAEAVWMNIILSVAIGRLLALLINGTFSSFRHSPTIRFAASCVASSFWMLFTTGVFTAWQESGGSPTGIVAYGTLTILEIRNTYVSCVDMVVARGTKDAWVKR